MLAGYIVPEVSFWVRFVHFDPTHTDDSGRLVDEVKLVIMATDEKLSDLCDFDSLELIKEQESDIQYSIDHIAERDNIFV
jgi:hypothetical protein